MDITKSSKKLFATKYINGITVNYGIAFSVGIVLFLILKQILKSSLIGLSAGIALPIAFALAMALLFLLEKKFVFNRAQLSSLPKQILWYLFRTLVDVGFFCVFKFAFDNIFKSAGIMPYIFSAVLIFVFNLYFDKLLVFDDITKEEQVKNGRCYKLFFRNRFVLLSVATASISILFVFMIFSLFPFGDMTVLRMDLYHQYGPLFVEFYDRITGFEGFNYSWRTGGGSSFLGNYFNYLSSPISFLIFLFDRKQIGYAITFLVLVKGALSAGTFTYFIKKSFDRHSYASAAFGVMYALSGYFLAYYWNIMWLDGMIWLPLIALGIENIINKGDGRLYIISLCILFYSSYYIGYMSCIFAVVYFLIYFFAHYEYDDTLSVSGSERKNIIKRLLNNRLFMNGVRFTAASVVSAAICAVVLIPVYYILQSCSATSDSWPNILESYFNLINLVSSHFAGLETTIRSSGDDVLPNIYCGMLTALLIPLYVVNKDIRLKEKAMYMLMVLFFVFSFDNNFANFIWHAFHFPNDLPYRFSFMYSFIILVMAFRVLMNFKSIEYRDIGFAGMIWVIIALLLQQNPTNKIHEITIYITLGFIIVWTGFLYLVKKGHMSKFVIGVTIIALTFCEAIIGDSQSYLFTQKQSDYVEYYDEYTEAVDHLKKNDDGFYKTELTYLGTRMDPCLYGYDGMSIFSSMAYEDYSQSQYSLGLFGNRINSFTYNTQTPVYNMMFNLKYLIQDPTSIAPSSNYYEEAYTTKSGKTSVFKNKYYLPIGFVASSELEEWDNSEGNPFEVQEDLIDRAAGVARVFEPVEFISTESGSTSCDEVTGNGTYFFSKDSNESYDSIDITMQAVNDSNMYVYITATGVENVNYYWENDSNSAYQNIYEPYIMDLGAFKKGETVTVSLDLNGVESDESYFEIYAYNINNDILASAYEMLSYGALNVTSHSDTCIEGTVNAGYDGYFYTSIPYDEGWKIYIDGQEAKTFSIGNNAHLCTTVKHGEHTVKIKYSPRGQRLGFAVSACGILALAGYELAKKRLNRSKSSNCKK